MNRDDVIRMAREAGESEGMAEFVFHPVIEHFAKLVAAAEREECAKVCDGLDTPKAIWSISRNCSAAIRARGTHD